MAFFGLGTVPLMTVAVYLGNFFKTEIKRRILKLVPIMVVFIGILFILRGLGLNIPYISPTDNVVVESVDAQFNCH